MKLHAFLRWNRINNCADFLKSNNILITYCWLANIAGFQDTFPSSTNIIDSVAIQKVNRQERIEWEVEADKKPEVGYTIK